MKKILSLLMVLLMVFAVASCGKDDPNMPTTVTADKTYEITFMVGGGQPTSNAVTMNIGDFSGIASYAKNVYKADLVPAGASLTITGITAGGHELKGAKLALDGTKTTLDLGNLTQDKTTTTTTDINFLQQVANRIVSNKSASVTFSTTQSVKDISRTVPVKIKMNVIFHLK